MKRKGLPTCFWCNFSVRPSNFPPRTRNSIKSYTSQVLSNLKLKCTFNCLPQAWNFFSSGFICFPKAKPYAALSRFLDGARQWTRSLWHFQNLLMARSSSRRCPHRCPCRCACRCRCRFQHCRCRFQSHCLVSRARWRMRVWRPDRLLTA